MGSCVGKSKAIIKKEKNSPQKDILHTEIYPNKYS